MAASKSHASVADLVTKLHTNIDSIHATLSLLTLTSATHSAELERLSAEREAKIQELRTAHENALKELAAQRQKDAEELAEQRRRGKEELEVERQREYEELMARRKREDEERERILKEKEEERIRMAEEEDARREAEMEETERSLQEKVERELEELEDEMERKVKEGTRALRELDERRKAINAAIDAALNTPTVIPTMHFRSRAKTSKRLTNGFGSSAGVSPMQLPVSDMKSISEVDTEGEEENKNVEAPFSDHDSVVNGSRDIIQEEVKPATAPEAEQTQDVPHETESTPVEPVLEEAKEESPAADHDVFEDNDHSTLETEIPAQLDHKAEEITENKDILHDEVETSHIEQPIEAESDISVEREELPSVEREIHEANDLARPEPDIPLEPADQTEEATDNKEIENEETPAVVDSEDEDEVDSGKVLPESENKLLDGPAVLGNEDSSMVDSLSPEVEKEKDDTQDDQVEDNALNVPALNASEDINVKVNTELNAIPADGTDIMQETDSDKEVTTAEPALEILEAESKPTDQLEPSQDKEHEMFEPSEPARAEIESNSKDLTSDIAHEDMGHQEQEPSTPIHLEPESDSKDLTSEIFHGEEHHQAAGDVNHEGSLDTEVDHEDPTSEIVHSEEQPQNHLEDLHETSEIPSEPVEDVVTRMISPVEDEAQLQDPTSGEEQSVPTEESGEETAKEISPESEHDQIVAEGDPPVHEKEHVLEEHELEQPSLTSEHQEADVSDVPVEQQNVPESVEHSASSFDPSEEIQLPEHDNVESNTSHEATDKLEHEIVSEEASLPEDSHPPSLHNEVEQEPTAHSEPAKDSTADDSVHQEPPNEQSDEKELEPDKPAMPELELMKDTPSAIIESESAGEETPINESNHDTSVHDETTSKEGQDEIPAEPKASSEELPLTDQLTLSESQPKDTSDIEIPAVISHETIDLEEKFADSEIQAGRSAKPEPETVKSRDIESHEVAHDTESNEQDDSILPAHENPIHDIPHDDTLEDHDQDSDKTPIDLEVPDGEESGHVLSQNPVVAEATDIETHGVPLSEASYTHLEGSDNPASDTAHEDESVTPLGATSDYTSSSYAPIDVFRYLEPEHTDTTEAEAYDTMDEGAPLNGSTGPQGVEERSFTPVQHQVVAEASHINRFAESPATVLNTDDLFDDDTDSENSDSEDGDDADQENDDEEEDEETYDSENSDEDEEEEDSDEPVPEAVITSKIERSFPHVVSHMPSYEFGKPKMVDPFSEGSLDQVDFSSSHRSSGLFASLVDTIKSDMPAVEQMVNNGESSQSLKSEDNEDYHSMSDYSQATPRTKDVPNAFQETDEEGTSFQDTFSHHESENLHTRSHTADTIPSFESFAQSDAESSPSETPSSPFQEVPNQEPRIESWSVSEQDEHREFKPEASPLRAEFDPYGTKNYPKYVMPKPSQANLRSPRSRRFPQSIDSTKAQDSPRGSILSMSPSPTAQRFPRVDSTEAAFSEDGPYDFPPSRTLSLHDSTPTKQSPPSQQPTPAAPNTSAKTTVSPALPSNSFFQKTRSLFESSAQAAPTLSSSVARPLSGYFNVSRGSTTSPQPRRKESMANLRSFPPPLEEDILVTRSLDGDGKPPSPAFRIPSRRDSTTSQRKSSHGSISRVENDLTPFTPSKNIRPRSSNPFLGLSSKIVVGEKGLEDSIYNPDREKAMPREPLLSRRDSWGNAGTRVGNES